MSSDPQDDTGWYPGDITRRRCHWIILQGPSSSKGICCSITAICCYREDNKLQLSPVLLQSEKDKSLPWHDQKGLHWQALNLQMQVIACQSKPLMQMQIYKCKITQFVWRSIWLAFGLVYMLRSTRAPTGKLLMRSSSSSLAVSQWRGAPAHVTVTFESVWQVTVAASLHLPNSLAGVTSQSLSLNSCLSLARYCGLWLGRPCSIELSIWKNNPLGKSGYPRISLYRFR